MEQQVNTCVIETPEQLAARRLAAIEAWSKAIQPKKEWEAYERTKRQEVVQLCFPNPIKGTNRFEIGDGRKVKMIYGYSYSLGDKDLVDPILQTKVPVETQVTAILEAISELGEYGQQLAQRLVKWEPKLSETEYKKLRQEVPVEAEAKRLIDSILTSKPNSPQLEIEQPK